MKDIEINTILIPERITEKLTRQEKMLFEVLLDVGFGNWAPVPQIMINGNLEKGDMLLTVLAAKGLIIITEHNGIEYFTVSVETSAILHISNN